MRPVGSNRDPRSELRVAFRHAAGASARRGGSCKHPRIAPPALAGNARGDLALAWFEDRGTTNDRVYVALRRAGQAFGKPIRLATGRVRSVSAAVGSRGDVLVAWDARGKVRARLRRRGRGLRPRGDAALRPGVLRRAAHRGRELRPRLRGVGRAARSPRAASAGPGFYEAAVRPAGAARFRRAQRLERLGAGPRRSASLDLALTGRGNALVAWAADRVRAARDRRERPLRRPARPLGPARPTPTSRRPARSTSPPPPRARARRVDGGRPARPGRLRGARRPFGPPEDVGARRRVSRAAFPGGRPSRGRSRQADGVHVQEATRAG